MAAEDRPATRDEAAADEDLEGPAVNPPDRERLVAKLRPPATMLLREADRGVEREADWRELDDLLLSVDADRFLVGEVDRRDICGLAELRLLTREAVEPRLDVLPWVLRADRLAAEASIPIKKTENMMIKAGNR